MSGISERSSDDGSEQDVIAMERLAASRFPRWVIAPEECPCNHRPFKGTGQFCADAKWESRLIPRS
jgi:hypothetical protein